MQIKKRNGFSILAIILVIVAVIVAIGVWALSGQTNTSSSADSSTSILASTIVNDSSSIKLAYDTLNIQNASNIVFVPNQSSNSNSQNILDPLNSIAVLQAPSKAMNLEIGEPAGIWVYSKNFGTMNGPSNNDTVVLLAGIKDTVCKSINKNLHGSEVIPEYGPFNGASQFVAGATALNPNTNAQVEFNSAVITREIFWTSGCIRPLGATDQNVFFRVLKVS